MSRDGRTGPNGLCRPTGGATAADRRTRPARSGPGASRAGSTAAAPRQLPIAARTAGRAGAPARPGPRGHHRDAEPAGHDADRPGPGCRAAATRRHPGSRARPGAACGEHHPRIPCSRRGLLRRPVRLGRRRLRGAVRGVDREVHRLPGGGRRRIPARRGTGRRTHPVLLLPAGRGVRGGQPDRRSDHHVGAGRRDGTPYAPPRRRHARRTQERLFRAYHQAGRNPEAIALCEEIIADKAEFSGPDDPSVFIWTDKLAHLLHDAGDLAGAIACYERAIHGLTEITGPRHPDLAFRHNLAIAHLEDGHPQRALPHLERALAIREGALEPHHADNPQHPAEADLRL
ncbi:tetratricopeptide repeat protein [Streptomyces sp. NPDC051310]|uniref:tetratricopeptide repeat protein n=1 Tax=Streptomyces sp. NPDC051310 TaxID=3365649 RepID=UPI0037A9E2B9